MHPPITIGTSQSPKLFNSTTRFYCRCGWGWDCSCLYTIIVFKEGVVLISLFSSSIWFHKKLYPQNASEEGFWIIIKICIKSVLWVLVAITENKDVLSNDWIIDGSKMFGLRTILRCTWCVDEKFVKKTVCMYP